MAAATDRQRTATHDGFLRHARFRWAKVAGAASLVALLAYLLIDVQPRHNGGSAFGYTLGTIATLMILWLTMLGVRKRAMTPGRWSLKAWTSAHVYLGLSLIVIATLHSGFQFGWNVHTLAWALMMVVIISGLFGVAAYATLPRLLSDNRAETTETQMLESLRSIDRQLHDAAQPLDQHQAALVQSSLDDDPFGGGLRARITGRYPACATRVAHAALHGVPRVEALLDRKIAMLDRVRRHLRLKALLELWLYVHVPVTFALIAALSAHIVSVFFYW
jgi:hypothetical protein